MKLRNVSIEVSNFCNMRCEGCYFWKQRQEKTLSTNQIKDIIDMIGKPERLVFIGGEPFMNKNLLKLCKYASEKSTKPDILTNGWYCNKNNLAKLKPFINEIQVSLDYPIPKLHNERRGLPEAFSKAVDALQWTVLLRIPRTIAFTCGKFNFGYLSDMLNLSKNLKAELKILRFIPYSKEDRINNLTPFQTEYLCRVVYKNNLTSSIPMISIINHMDQRCDAGVNRLCFRANGDVGPCDFVPRTFGNITKESLDSIMKKMLTWREKNFAKTKEACKWCKNFDRCWGGCQAMIEVYKEYKDAGCWV